MRDGRPLRRRLRVGLLWAACSVAASGCAASLGELSARASDAWTRTYPLTATGELQVSTVNGRIELEGVNGSMVEVRAERVVRAVTDEMARELLPRVDISEDVRPDRVSIDTHGLSGLKIGASVEVNYHVKVPRTALVRARTTNGEIVVEGISGRLVATTTNGAISARGMSGGVEARATNGRIAVEMNAMGTDPIDIRTTNGAVDLKIPTNAKAYVTANSVNGGIDMTTLMLELIGEQSKRRVRGRMNGGGIPIDVGTANGRIVVSTQ